jgi:signal transduction histidine kinase/anti-sigma regulatory factor (Ser/Thr protein kinase)
MNLPILTVAIEQESDIVLARQKARRIADLLGFGAQDQTRIATAVSEIVRNVFAYACGGSARFTAEGRWPAQQLVVRVSDVGPGIGNLDEILAGRYRSTQGMGVGITGSKRLMDTFLIETSGDGTIVTLGKTLTRPEPLTPSVLMGLVQRLIKEQPQDPLIEVRDQNQELLRSLTELRLKQEEADRLNAELEATNRGVVALHAELDQKATALETANDSLASLNRTLSERIETAVEARRRAEEGLRQSQKMEALGQLTGGIAHDFNNLLQIVCGNLELLDRLLPADATRLRRSSSNAMEGAQRAAVLVQRLLAFSRRQPLAPRVLEINALVSGMVDLLTRTIGENIGISMALEPGLWSVDADPNQLENALLNLAVNARDAMGINGKLTISTSNYSLDAEHALPGEWEAGDYVSLSVTDDGCGMSPETVAQVFEPFFTTKAIGKGTGLGLSMVYGFVKQSGGHAGVFSAIGSGTTLTLYLPRIRQLPQGILTTVVVPKAPVRGDAIILVVEDEAKVREYTVEVLSELGYTVLSAADGDTALNIIADNNDIVLLFTDVILPGQYSGQTLADAALLLLPKLKILYTTGYARDVILRDGRPSASLNLISKPFSYNDIAAKLHGILTTSIP